MHRIKGELMLDPSLDPSIDHELKAEASFHKALKIARHQRAKSLELRAAISLGRIWQKKGEKEKSRKMVTEVYSWFTEGFDTPDLIEAQRLLDELV
jgi:predicted ATPase